MESDQVEERITNDNRDRWDRKAVAAELRTSGMPPWC
jgi:hypothetical protein